MRARKLMQVAVTALALAGPAAAAPVDQVVEQLRAQGYQVREVQRTWLGRIRIEAVRGDRAREVVIDRVTGEVLRDYVRVSNGRSGGAGAAAGDDSGGGSRSGGSSGSGGGDDDDDRGGGSGSGGSGAGGGGDDDDGDDD